MDPGVSLGQDGWPGYTDQMRVAYSKDGGRTWHEEQHKVPITSPAEPAMLLYKDALIMIGRPYDKAAYDAKNFTTAGYHLLTKGGLIYTFIPALGLISISIIYSLTD